MKEMTKFAKTTTAEAILLDRFVQKHHKELAEASYQQVADKFFAATKIRLSAGAVGRLARDVRLGWPFRVVRAAAAAPVEPNMAEVLRRLQAAESKVETLQRELGG